MSNTIRVLYSFPYKLGRTGIGTTAWHQVNGLVKLGMRVTVLCGVCEQEISGVEQIVETMRVKKIRIPHKLFKVDNALVWHDWIVSRHLSKYHDNYDIVHSWPAASMYTLLEAKKNTINSFLERPNAHTRYAYNVVDQECKKLGVQLPKGHSHTFNGRRLRREEQEYALADRLLCPSDFVAESFIKYGFDSTVLVRHQYGFDDKDFPIKKSNELPTVNTPLQVLFVGSCEPRKGLHYALEAWCASAAKETGRFLICGRFIPGYERVLGSWLEHPSVEVVGFTNSVYEYIERSDALVLPSIEEGSALVTYEGRSSGCIPLVSNATGLMGSHMKDALVHDVGNVNLLKEHMNSLAQDFDFRLSLREASLELAPRLTWSHAAEALYDAYLTI